MLPSFCMFFESYRLNCFLLLLRFRKGFTNWILYKLFVLIGSDSSKLQMEIDLCFTLIWERLYLRTDLGFDYLELKPGICKKTKVIDFFFGFREKISEELKQNGAFSKTYDP
ncbi:hypothetical protein LBBP_03380 [Leptospira borgpetersenii serovar Ballum]|uniref:Uncharacterized protein n=2 Tax=Leptospira borgpetersenii TaxID=174 RepID=A0A0S2IV72_LEPBO|nr:hypothetical protein LBBP_03380 [Leptospira borgpetersenii serovar Ballum]ANH01867.2 Uncharacterized protein LB4E_2650 [Leptospira borgpetersenii str. 4E]